MSKDPREGLKLRLGYEVAREIERTPAIAPGVSDAAVRAVSSVLYQRLQDQIIDDNSSGPGGVDKRHKHDKHCVGEQYQ